MKVAEDTFASLSSLSAFRKCSQQRLSGSKLFVRSLLCSAVSWEIWLKRLQSKSYGRTSGIYGLLSINYQILCQYKGQSGIRTR